MSVFYTNVYNRGNKIYVMGYANGKRYKEEVEYEPYLFVPQTGSSSEFRTLDNISVDKKQFGSIREARDFMGQYEGVGNFQYYGFTNFQYVFINDEFPGTVDYDIAPISVVNIDIEVESKQGFPRPERPFQEVTAISLVKRGKVLLFGTKYYKPKLDNVQYVLCNNEVDLLNKFLDAWESEDWAPDVVTGWFIENFDIPYLIARITRVLSEKAAKRLSPWRIINERDIIRGKGTSDGKDISKRTDVLWEIAGVTQLDYLNLYKQFTFKNHESYKLDHIANVELGERKIDYSEYKSLDELYEKDPEKYYDYNIHDSVLVEKLENKLGFIKQVFAMAYLVKSNFIDVLTTTRPWDIVIHNFLLAKGIVVPQPNRSEVRTLIGAHVQEPQIGMHKWVVSFDFKSLYPSLISALNISPETFLSNGFQLPNIDKIVNGRRNDIINEVRARNMCVAANKCGYTKDRRGFIPEIVDFYIAERDRVKQEMLELEKKKGDANKIVQLHNHQQALKILTNGLYGALANKYFRWFDLNLAESVTLSGQLYIMWTMARVNEYLNKVLKTEKVDYIVAGDTDSIYVTLDSLVKQIAPEDPIGFLDNVCKAKLEPVIKAACLELDDLLNAYNHCIVMKREVIADKAIWRKMKNYCLNVWDKEGVRYDKPKQQYKGLEVVRSSTPMVCRDHLKKCLEIIMTKDEPTLQAYIANVYQEFTNLTVDQIGFPRTINGLDQYYDPTLLCKSGTPIHVRGAIMFNEFLKKNSLTAKFKAIEDREKIKFVYLKQPNPLQTYVVALPDTHYLPPDMGIEEYVDRELQWEKAFLSPIKSLTDVIGWSTEKRTKVSLFFKRKT